MRLRLFSSLYGRIFAIFWLTMLLVLIAVLILPFLDPRQPHDIPKDHFERVKQSISKLEEKYSDHPNIQAVARKLTNRGGKHHGKRPLIYLTDLEGNLITRERGPIRKAMQNYITELDLTQIQPQQKLYGRMMVAGPFPAKIANQDVLLFNAMKWNQTPPFLLQLFDKPFQLLFAVMVASTPLLLWLAWALSQPARRLEKAAKRVAKGEFVADPDLEKGTREFQQAGASFNQMVLAVDQMITGQQRLLSDISHELRSPLTRLRMTNALATRKQGESDELKRIDTEAERLEQMISELLELSRMQVHSHENRERLSVVDLWEEILKDAQFEADQKGKVLRYGSFHHESERDNPLPNTYIYGNPNLLMSAVENIVRNAIHYGNQNIQVSIVLNGSELQIDVDDDGNGVPKEELEDIFRPFYRVSTARDRHSGGAGLGLAITESAIRQHNGTIKAQPSSLGGLKMSIRLPVSEHS
ncbi:two-component system sensor histidine kinase CpxA [Vibrio sp. vnigr-6D03]|uniref:envelope stress sensor histidine kinase CpxA n=1 Tax=Vibrio sp. vnigr-6D03 TaxID=2058088 RepID=UPI000C33CABC|nr:envelope stress sensor histidine kinase CpxA [Vibrio sp. vnigr-6D03]PKF80595.1 two-component system sensor histidine kinase CpxA [Vibrio sp. vnigr-6D03]